MREDQFQYMRSAFPEFESYGLVDEPEGRSPVNALFYHRDSLRAVSAGGYWLSETPHVAGSSSWDSACVRLANWVRLEVIDLGKEVRVINTHLDHVSQQARERQARLVVQDAQAYPEPYPQVLTGDMNCDSTNEAIAALRRGGWRDTYKAVHGMDDPGHTFHRFLGPAFESRVGKMDWVFVRGALKVIDAQVVRDSQDGRFPSDHYFVSAEIEL
jgi:endonuclease/exonuclease/phosphatase family metal-dependent hydrolase